MVKVSKIVSKTKLLKLQKSLVTDGAIAKKFNVTRPAIQQLRYKYGIESTRAKNPERNKKIIAMFKSGNVGKEIAPKFGISVSQAYHIRDENSGKRSKKTAKKSKK
jgi:DNA invertase Pin-like site-specific DNA recombinase